MLLLRQKVKPSFLSGACIPQDQKGRKLFCLSSSSQILHARMQQEKREEREEREESVSGQHQEEIL